MTKFIHIRPVNGARVLNPNALPVPAPLPPEGAVVVDTVYWRRRMKAREVEMISEAVVAADANTFGAPETVKEQKKGKGKQKESVNTQADHDNRPPETGQGE